jgi:hypothetical protein
VFNFHGEKKRERRERNRKSFGVKASREVGLPCGHSMDFDANGVAKIAQVHSSNP